MQHLSQKQHETRTSHAQTMTIIMPALTRDALETTRQNCSRTAVYLPPTMPVLIIIKHPPSAVGGAGSVTVVLWLTRKVKVVKHHLATFFVVLAT
jgi:hypothetical protein